MGAIRFRYLWSDRGEHVQIKNSKNCLLSVQSISVNPFQRHKFEDLPAYDGITAESAVSAYGDILEINREMKDYRRWQESKRELLAKFLYYKSLMPLNERGKVKFQNSESLVYPKRNELLPFKSDRRKNLLLVSAPASQRS